jgi:hypothetical protein
MEEVILCQLSLMPFENTLESPPLDCKSLWVALRKRTCFFWREKIYNIPERHEKENILPVANSPVALSRSE